MYDFLIEPFWSWYTNILTNQRERGQFLKRQIQGYYHAEYSSGGNWQIDDTIENLIWTLKNDTSTFPNRIEKYRNQLTAILLEDLSQVLNNCGHQQLVLCVVPRAKKDVHYRADQLLFRSTVESVALSLGSRFINGTNYLMRQINTKTTHLTRGRDNRGGDGNMPYPGITKDTCIISSAVNGKNILLIDDLYTKNVNIDEDAIQALLDSGANSVLFYAVGKTVPRAIVDHSPEALVPTGGDDLPF